MRAVHADLPLPGVDLWNEVVTAPDGGAYVNGGESIVRVHPDGSVRVVADGLAVPNGMAVAGDGITLVVAEPHASRLTSFELAPNGDLRARRVWAEIPGAAPDGICLGPPSSVWVRRCAEPMLSSGRRSRRSAPDR